MTDGTEFPLSVQMKDWDRLNRPADSESYAPAVAKLEAELERAKRELAEAQQCDDPTGAILRLKADLADAKSEIIRLNGNWDDAINFVTRERIRAGAAEESLRMAESLLKRSKSVLMSHHRRLGPNGPLPGPLESDIDAALASLGVATTGMEGGASLNDVLAIVRTYRAVQDEEHGGPKHDDSHFPTDWVCFIRKFTDRALLAATRKILPDDGPVGYENNLFHIAALAVSAIQSSRRKRAKT
jgi:hypothetical protein